jgi:hypothetical protein
VEKDGGVRLIYLISARRSGRLLSGGRLKADLTRMKLNRAKSEQNHVKLRCLRRFSRWQGKELRVEMAKRRGNPNWGKPEPIGPVVPTVTSFEQIVKEYKLTPDQYTRSTRLREWARRNKNSKYIPEALLEAWGFEIESTL